MLWLKASDPGNYQGKFQREISESHWLKLLSLKFENRIACTDKIILQNLLTIDS